MITKPQKEKESKVLRGYTPNQQLKPPAATKLFKGGDLLSAQ